MDTEPQAAAPRRRKKKKKRAPVDPGGGPPAAGSTDRAAASSRRAKLLFAAVALLVVALAVLLGRYAARRNVARPWDVGDVVDVEITLVATDAKSLACASPNEVAGRHCAFEAATKPWSKGGAEDDKAILRPYTTTDGKSFAAAGMWTEPALDGKLPGGRFSVRCKLAIEGKLAKPSVRWGGPWIDTQADWLAGVISRCSRVDAQVGPDAGP